LGWLLLPVIFETEPLEVEKKIFTLFYRTCAANFNIVNIINIIITRNSIFNRWYIANKEITRNNMYLSTGGKMQVRFL